MFGETTKDILSCFGVCSGSVSRPSYVRMSVVSAFVKLFVFFVFGLGMMTEGRLAQGLRKEE